MPRTHTKPVRRLTLTELCADLGISRMTFYRRWRDVFTPIRNDAGEWRFNEDEVLAAQVEREPARARAAVVRLRKQLARITDEELLHA